MKEVFIDSVTKDNIIINPNADMFNFLNMSGRKRYYNQGYCGQDTIVAVVDSGVSPHIEFENRLLAGKNFCTTGYCSDTPLDENGHGTHVAGTVAGKLCGIAPKARILPVKVLDLFGNGRIRDVITALQWCKTWKSVDGKKIDIINLSLSSSEASFIGDPTLLNDYHNAIKELVASGIAVIVAAGNSGKEGVKYPAFFEEVITVGAVDLAQKVASFTTKSKQIDLCQIGIDVLSASHSNKNAYVYSSGTSMASPHVAGIAALLISKAKAMGISLKDSLTTKDSGIYNTLKMNSVDVDIKGLDISTGAGFCTLHPSLDKIKFEMISDNKYILVNGKKVMSDAAPITIPPGRFMAPVRFIVENLGGQASYDVVTKKATFEIML